MEDQEFINQLAEKLSKLGTVRPLGFHYLHPYGTVPADSIICNGATYSRALYKDFFDYITTQGWVKTEAEWQEIAERDNGFCPFYSEGDGSTNFRTPRFAPYQQVAMEVANATTYNQEGLPDLTGDISSWLTLGESQLTSGVFKSSIKGSTEWTGTSSHWGDVASTIRFKASDSSPVYGRSNTVQPESHEWVMCVVAYGVATNVGSVDVQNVMSAVNAVQAQVGEIPKPNAYVTKTWRSGSNWYRKWSDGWIEQGGVYTSTSDKTVSFYIIFSSKPVLYTAPKHNTSSNPGLQDLGYDVTNANFKAYGVGANGGYECHWLACGY